MRLTTSQLQSKHKALVEALKRGETVEITYHGLLLGVVHPAAQQVKPESQAAAMEAFFGMHSDSDVTSVEAELRQMRKGRRAKFDDL